MGRPRKALRDKSGHGHDGKPESDLGLPEIVDSDGSQAVRLGGSGMVDCGAVADFDREDPYSLGAWFKPRGDGFRTLMGTMDHARSRLRPGVRRPHHLPSRVGVGGERDQNQPRAPPIPMTPGIMSSARMMAHREARVSRFMLTGLKRLLTPRTTT